MGKWLKSIWLGQSKSRDPATAKFAGPDGFDWERLIEEMGKTQEELLHLAASGGGVIYIRDITVQDEVNEEISDKVFDAVNGETVLESCVSSTTAVKVHIVSSFPMVLLGTTLVELDEATDRGNYEKIVNYTVIEDDIKITMVLPDGIEGAFFETNIEIIGGPVLLDLHFHGGYPGSQTEVKVGDTIQIQGTTETACNAARINAFGLADEQSVVFVSTNSFIISCVVKATGYTPAALAAQVQARNSSGAYGPVKQTDHSGSVDGYNLMNCNDKVPTFIDNGYTNSDNPGALAFKGTEEGIQDTTVANQDSLTYSSDDFAISDTAVYEKAKPITLVNPGDYNDSVINFTIVAKRNANASESTFEKIIEVADCVPILTVSQVDGRLRSALDHTITVTSNQNLDGAPDLGVPVSGTWLGSEFEAEPIGQLKIWTRDIQIVHADARGTGAWTQAVVATNRAGINANIVGNQIVGGFTEITIVFDHSPAWNLDVIGALSQVTDVNKLLCEDNSSHSLVYQVNKDDNPYAFTITDAGGNLDPAGNSIYWCDIAGVGANVSGTAFLKIEETI